MDRGTDTVNRKPWDRSYPRYRNISVVFVVVVAMECRHGLYCLSEISLSLLSSRVSLVVNLVIVVGPITVFKVQGILVLSLLCCERLRRSFFVV